MHVKIKAAMFNFVTYDKSREQPIFFYEKWKKPFRLGTKR